LSSFKLGACSLQKALGIARAELPYRWDRYDKELRRAEPSVEDRPR